MANHDQRPLSQLPVDSPYSILILGAGRGGRSLLNLFSQRSHIKILGIFDRLADTPALQLAHQFGIPRFHDINEVFTLLNEHPQTLVYNLTGDDTIAHSLTQAFPALSITSGTAARLFWDIISNLNDTKEMLEDSQRRLKAIIDSAMDAIIAVNEQGLIEAFNPAAERQFGYLPTEIIGQSLFVLLPHFAPDFLKTFSFNENRAHYHEWIAQKKSGEDFSIEASLSEITLVGKKYFIAIMRDISERKKAQEQILFLAHHDFLTSLPNRASFYHHYRQSIAMAQRLHLKLGLLFVDLDHFKPINDTYGHQVGDKILEEIGRRLKLAVRTSDIASRIGGDEFTIILQDIHDLDTSLKVSQKILDQITHQPIIIAENQQISVRASIGLAIFPDHATESETLIQKADTAMYRAKGKGGQQIFIANN